jgi:hypothetical protein
MLALGRCAGGGRQFPDGPSGCRGKTLLGRRDVAAANEQCLPIDGDRPLHARRGRAPCDFGAGSTISPDKMMLDGEFVGRHPPTTDVARTSSKRQP